QAVLGLLKLLERGGIVDDVAADADLAHLGARLGDGDERLLLEVGRPLHGLDEVGGEGGAALVDVFHLSPLHLHRLVQGDQPVVAHHARAAEHDKEADHYDPDQGSALHGAKVHTDGGRGKGSATVKKTRAPTRGFFFTVAEPV